MRPPVVAITACVLEHSDLVRERRELLPELIVHFSADSASLILLREHQSRQKFAARAFRLSLLPRCEIEMRSHDSHDGSALLAADRISTRENVHVLTVLVAQGEFPFIRRRTALDAFIHLLGPCHVFGME